MRARSALLAVLTALIALAAFSSSASAAKYCLYEGNCDGVPANVRPATEAGLVSAIAAAQASIGVDDVIELGSEPIVIDSTLDAEATSTNNLLIKGKPGAGATLHFVHDGDSGINFNALGAPASGFENLAVQLDGASAGPRNALQLVGGSATEMKFDIKSPSGHAAFGLFLYSSAKCEYCSFHLYNDETIGVYASGTSSIDKSDFRDEDPGFADTTGVIAQNGAGDVLITNSKFIAVNRSIDVRAETVTLRDSIIDMGDNEEAEGVYVNLEGSQSGTGLATVDGVTFAGAADGQQAVYVEAQTGSAGGEYATANITNSLFKLTGGGSSEVACLDDGTFGTGTVSLTYSFKRPTTPSAIGCQDTSTATNLNSTGIPVEDIFVDWDEGDLRLAPNAYPIDAGDPSTVKTDRFLDAYGFSRFKIGDSGTDIIDIGASEYQDYPPARPTVTASATTVTVGQPITFGAEATDPNGDPITFNWSFGDGSPTASGSAQTHIFTAPGKYNVDVWAQQSNGQQGLPGRVTITVNPVPAVPRAVSDCCSAGAGYTNAKFTFKKGAKLKNGFTVIIAKPKKGTPFIPITTNGKMAIKLTFTRTNAGFLDGTKCKAKKGKTGSAKRCALPVKGTQTVELPEGTSYIIFGGKWNKKALPAGKYTLIGTNPSAPANQLKVQVQVYTAKQGSSGKTK